MTTSRRHPSGSKETTQADLFTVEAGLRQEAAEDTPADQTWGKPTGSDVVLTSPEIQL